MVDIVNVVGVDINRAVVDPYYQHLLPYVCGLGPRKAQVLVKKIASMVLISDAAFHPVLISLFRAVTSSTEHSLFVQAF